MKTTIKKRMVQIYVNEDFIQIFDADRKHNAFAKTAMAFGFYPYSARFKCSNHQKDPRFHNSTNQTDRFYE